MLYQFSDENAAKCDWIPSNVKGKNVKFLISCTDDSQFLDTLRGKIDPAPVEIVLTDFDMEARSLLVEAVLGRYNKVRRNLSLCE